MKPKIFIFLLAMIGLSIAFMPSFNVSAQDCGVPDSTGAVTPCPAEKPTKRPGVTPIPPTSTPTATETSTLTATIALSSTATKIHSTSTNTPTITPTSTPIPPQVSAALLPGVGIGAVILFLIIGIILPISQRIRVSKRGY